MDTKSVCAGPLQDGMGLFHFLGRTVGDDQMLAALHLLFVVKNVFLGNPQFFRAPSKAPAVAPARVPSIPVSRSVANCPTTRRGPKPGTQRKAVP